MLNWLIAETVNISLIECHIHRLAGVVVVVVHQIVPISVLARQNANLSNDGESIMLIAPSRASNSEPLGQTIDKRPLQMRVNQLDVGLQRLRPVRIEIGSGAR